MDSVACPQLQDNLSAMHFKDNPAGVLLMKHHGCLDYSQK